MDPAGSRPEPSARVLVALQHGVVVHYHEIGLKGRNRGFFERRLVRNLEDAIDGCERARVEVLTGRLIVHTPGVPSAALLDRVGRVFGVASYAPCATVESAIPAMSEAALALLAPRSFDTFAVAARRATKELPFNSRDVNIELGAAVQAATGKGVNLGSPDVTVYVEVVGPRSFVYVERRGGPGGLPVGSSGKVVSLLSGGIDSPVATYRIMRRGAKAILCHFHSAPFTDRSSVRKAAELAALIAYWQGDTPLYLVPLGDAQQQIVLSTPPDLRVVLYRRLMVRIAADVARQEGAKALVLGDSLGQVASQTLENIACVDDVSPLPLLRPLIGEDKQAIVTEARIIGTYETSILPFEDCCSLFVPRSPATRATVDECRSAEAELDVAGLVHLCLEGTELVRVRREPCREAS